MNGNLFKQKDNNDMAVCIKIAENPENGGGCSSVQSSYM